MSTAPRSSPMPLRVAVVQCGSRLFDAEATLAHALEMAATAAADAELIVLPEALLGGYPKGLDFGVRIGLRSPEGREQFRRYWEAAIDVPGPETEAFAALAAEHETAIVLGAVVREGQTLICSTLLFDPQGNPPLVHRKLVPTAGERFIWGRGDGSTLATMPLGEVTVGSVICWENYMPLLRAAMYAKKVDIWCASTVDDREVWQSTMRHIALEGRCFVLSACQFLRRDGLPEDAHPIQGEAPETVLIDGGSVIVSPLGEVLAGPVYGAETIVRAELDLAELARARMDFDVNGHYARPDVFNLRVNEAPQRSVEPG